MILNTAYETNVGKVRDNNEDKALVLKTNEGTFFIISDGMGGHRNGQLASELTIQSFVNEMKIFFDSHEHPKTHNIKKAMIKSVKATNNFVYKKSLQDANNFNMGATICVAFVGLLETIIVNVGDSRAYIFKDKQFMQLTEDQTYVQFLYNCGKITKEEILTHPKRHVLLSAIGVSPTIVIDSQIIPNDFEKILICSDGLYNMVSTSSMEEIVEDSKLETENKVTKLVEAALLSGGLDNIGLCLGECMKEETE